jgi:hypothetical protein
MNQDLREALDDADKWYELYLGQKMANKRLVKEIELLKAELLKSEQHYVIVSEILSEKQNVRGLAHG